MIEVISIYTCNEDGKSKRKYFAHFKNETNSFVELTKNGYRNFKYNLISKGYLIVECKYRNELIIQKENLNYYH